VKDDHVEMTHSDSKPELRRAKIHQRVASSYMDSDDKEDSEKDSSNERATDDDFEMSRSDIDKRHHRPVTIHSKADSSYIIDSDNEESDKDLFSEEEDCSRHPRRRVANLKTLD
jgi:hypothetical protein